MPIIEMTIVEGRDGDVIERCMKEISQTVQSSLGVPEESVRVIVREVPKNRFAVGNALKSEMQEG